MRTIRIKTKSNDVKEIEKSLNLKLMAREEHDVVNGHVNFVKVKDWYEAEVFLYEEDRPATFEKYKKDGIDYVRGNKTSFKSVVGVDYGEKLKNGGEKL